jgi:LysR family glycine cleavage system transcriptional activator
MSLPRSKLPSLTELKAFEASARLASLTAAARELALTQSAVSKQIQQLEATLGRKLFQRTGQKVVLTAAGELFAEDVRDIILRLERATQSISTAGEKGVLKIAASPTFSVRWLIPRLPEFFSQNPEVTVEMTTDMHNQTRPLELAFELLDVIIHYGRPNWPYCVATRLFDDEVVAVTSPKYRKKMRIKAPADLRRVTLLQQITRPVQWRDWLQGCDVDLKAFHVGPAFDQLAMTIEAVVSGWGVALLPRYMISEEIASGKIEVLFNHAIRQSAYYLVIPLRKKDDQLVRKLADWIEEAAAGERKRLRNFRSFNPDTESPRHVSLSGFCDKR